MASVGTLDLTLLQVVRVIGSIASVTRLEPD